MPKLIRVTTVPIALKYLLAGQMRYMKEHGFEVIMVSADAKERDEIMKSEGCPHHVIPMTRKITPLADLRSLLEMYRYFKKEKPDIVHSHTPKAGLIAMIAAKWAGVKIRVHTIAGLRFMTSRGLTYRVLVSMEKLTARYATHVWPNSFSLLQIINEKKLVKKSKMEVIGKGSSNGIDLSRFSPSQLSNSKLEEIKRSIHFQENCIYLLSVGRIVRDKGVSELVSAFRRLYEKDNRLRLILVGEFEDALDPINAEEREFLKTHPAVILTGWKEEVEYYMYLSSILVHPSYREGFPNVLLQAGAMGCPIVCSRIEGNVDVVTHNQTGLIFEPRNPEELYNRLEFALQNPAVMKGYSSALRTRIEQDFDRRSVHDKLLKKYLELLEKEGFTAENRKITQPA
jgi:glycosyltransferase involved in cell wall biosynthesis